MNNETHSSQWAAVGTLLQTTLTKWYGDNIPRHAAALAYYSLFAVAPLLVMVAAIASWLYGRDQAVDVIVAQVTAYVHSPALADLIRTILNNAIPVSSSRLLTSLSVVALIYGGAGVFGELQSTLNLIWEAPPQPSQNLWGILTGRLFIILMVLLGGVLLFCSLLVSMAVANANQWMRVYLAAPRGYSEGTYFFVFFGLTALLFVLVYKFVPNMRVAWHDVIIGAVATAFLTSVARLLISWYLSRTSAITIFGATSSLVIFLLWAYYSAQIFFLGAEFTHVYGIMFGSRRPEAQLEVDLLTAPPNTDIEDDLAPEIILAHEVPLTTNGVQLQPLVSPIILAPESLTSDINEQPEDDGVDVVIAEESTIEPADKQMNPSAEDGVVLSAGEDPPGRLQQWRRRLVSAGADKFPFKRAVKPAEASASVATDEPPTSAESEKQPGHWQRLGQRVARISQFPGYRARSVAEQPTSIDSNPAPPAKPPSRLQQLGQQLLNVSKFPLKVSRPVGEVAVAVGVIGVVSVVAMLGLPWRKRRSAE